MNCRITVNDISGNFLMGFCNFNSNINTVHIVEDRITNLQKELMKIFSLELTEEELSEVRNMLAKYFAGRASSEMDKLWKERGYSQETINEWLNSHLRTPY